MKRVLFFVYLETHFIELARVAALLRARAGYEVVFFFAFRYPARPRDIATCVAVGYRCLDIDGKPVGQAAPAASSQGRGGAKASIPRRLWRLLPERLRQPLSLLRGWLYGLTPRSAPLAFAFPQLPSYLGLLRDRRRLAEAILADVAPTILILPEDNVEFVTGELIRAARLRGVPSLIVPFTIVNAEEIAEAYWHNPEYSLERWRNRLAGALYPKWVYEHRGRRLMPLPADRIVATELFGMSPPNPWIINSGNADAIAVESQLMRDYYLAAGLPEKKLALTGALYDDVMFEQIRSAGRADLRKELGLDSRKPLLLCALPPDQFRSARPGAEFASYKETVHAWGRALKRASEFAVLVRPHPRTPPEEVAFLSDEYGLAVTLRDTAALIPHCDLYVACVSATIRMAIAAGKPVLNYDCYRFGYHDFAAAPGVVTVQEQAAFESELERLADVAQRDALAGKQREFSIRANLLDGKAHERVLALVGRLTQKAKP